MRVELGLGDPDRLGEVFVGQLRVDDLVAVLGQIGRFDATWADCQLWSKSIFMRSL